MKQLIQVLLALAVASVPALSQETRPAAASDIEEAARETAARPRIVIVGVQKSADLDSRDAWMTAAIEETLTWRLRRTPGLITIPTMRAYQARRELQDDTAEPDWPRVVKLLGAQRHISGIVSGLPTAVTLKLSIADLDKGGPAQTFSCGPAPLFDVLAHATRELIGRCGVSRLSAELEAALLAPPGTTTSALEYFAKSILAMRSDNARDAFYYAERMFEYDADFRPGQLYYAQLELRLRPAERPTTAIRLRRLSEAARAANDPLDASEVEYAQGLLQLLTRSLDTAQLRFESSLQAARAAQDPYSLLGAMNGLADLCVEQGTAAAPELPEAQRKEKLRQYLEKAVQWQSACLALLRSLGDSVAEAPTTVKIAMLYEQLGENEKAFAMHQRTLAAAQATGSRRGQSTAWMLIGQAHRSAGRPADALDALGRCLELTEPATRPTVRLTIADILQDPAINQASEAIRQLETAWKELEAGSDFVAQLRCLRALADARYKSGQRAPAIDALQQAHDIAYAMGIKDEATIKKQLEEWKTAAK